MPTKEELERMDLTKLAVLCQQVADSPTASGEAADQARSMKQEWTLLIDSTTPPPTSPKDQQAKEAEKARLKRRMVSLLAAVLP